MTTILTFSRPTKSRCHGGHRQRSRWPPLGSFRPLNEENKRRAAYTHDCAANHLYGAEFVDPNPVAHLLGTGVRETIKADVIRRLTDRLTADSDSQKSKI